MNFLKEANRHFVIRQVVSSPLQSTCGLPEGCALSCIGMLLVNHCHALYMQQYAPQILSLSFVDNYELLVQDTFLELLCLETDPSKTYTWATRTQGRQSLHRLAHRVAYQERDLGGSMTYQAKPSPQSMERILADAQPLWATLRRMAGHSTQKEMLIKQAIWPGILHASGILHMTEGHIGKLRTCVVRALGHGKAGASPLIRLGYGRQPLLPFQSLEHFSGLPSVGPQATDARSVVGSLPLASLWETNAGPLFPSDAAVPSFGMVCASATALS